MRSRSQIGERSIGVQHARAKVRVHAASARHRIRFEICVRVQLREELLWRQQTEREHDRLIAIVSRSYITRLERACNCNLRDFLAVTENSEHRAAKHHLAACERADLPALE